MTPKEKANDIVKKYWMKNKNGQDSYNIAIQNAKICVDEIINDVPEYLGDLNPKRYYWKEVKLELEKL